MPQAGDRRRPFHGLRTGWPSPESCLPSSQGLGSVAVVAPGRPVSRRQRAQAGARGVPRQRRRAEQGGGLPGGGVGSGAGGGTRKNRRGRGEEARVLL